jgi:MinD superfamily P-loop ATPase
MKQIVVISGKGGTGKTVITASFAALAKNKIMADCDVDAPDLHLLLHPKIKERHKFIGQPKAIIDQGNCTDCGECVKVCRYNAIAKELNSRFVIDPFFCEGCKICAYICPVEAIRMIDNIGGEWYISATKYGPMVHARLGIAEGNSGKLVTVVRQHAKSIAEKERLEYVIIDGPPGMGCPVIASLSGVDVVLVITEPTLSGIHDMERAIGVAVHFGVKVVCVINKYDINLKNSVDIEDWCRLHNMPIVGKIPYNPVVIEALIQGIPVVEYSKNEVTKEINEIWQQLAIYDGIP